MIDFEKTAIEEMLTDKRVISLLRIAEMCPMWTPIQMAEDVSLTVDQVKLILSRFKVSTQSQRLQYVSWEKIRMIRKADDVMPMEKSVVLGHEDNSGVKMSANEEDSGTVVTIQDISKIERQDAGEKKQASEITYAIEQLEQIKQILSSRDAPEGVKTVESNISGNIADSSPVISDFADKEIAVNNKPQVKEAVEELSHGLIREKVDAINSEKIMVDRVSVHPVVLLNQIKKLVWQVWSFGAKLAKFRIIMEKPYYAGLFLLIFVIFAWMVLAGASTQSSVESSLPVAGGKK